MNIYYLIYFDCPLTYNLNESSISEAGQRYRMVCRNWQNWTSSEKQPYLQATSNNLKSQGANARKRRLV